jgi:hypothetical protein
VDDAAERMLSKSPRGSFPEAARRPPGEGPKFPQSPTTHDVGGAAPPRFPESATRPSGESPKFPEDAKFTPGESPKFPESATRPSGESPKFPSVSGERPGKDDGPGFPGVGRQGDSPGGLRDLAATMQGMARDVGAAVAALHAIGRSSGQTPNLQQLGGQTPAFVWDAGLDAYPAASPSVDSVGSAGLNGAGGYGYGSRGDRNAADFLEPGKRRVIGK